LAFSVASGFWLLFHGDPLLGIAGGFGLLLLPLPLVVSLTLSGVVRRRFGLIAGLTALVLTALTAEFALVSAPIGVPWLLLGHTQVEALPFVQTADIGGVLLLSLWVLLLNAAAFASLPLVRALSTGGSGSSAGDADLRRDVAWTTYIGDSGIAVALFAVLIALPAAYGAVRAGQAETPAGYARIGIVQPGIDPAAWDAEAAGRVDLLAELSDRLLDRWNAPDTSKATTPVEGSILRVAASTTERAPVRSRDEPIGILIWPQGTLPWMGSDAREAATLGRLSEWCRRRDVALITGSTTLGPGEDTDRPQMTSALRVSPTGEIARYDQMRRIPVADVPASPGERRQLLPVGGVRVAALLGFESLFGNHVRHFARDGADLFVVLARSDRWGRSSGPYQHLHATRLRAIETRRSVVVASAGGLSAVVAPSGRIEQTSGWMEQNLVPLDVPLYRAETFYAQHGDWVGRWAFMAALLLYAAAAAVAFVWPRFEARLR
ncbi:MAG TPA: nitrilase-related carbon-nitrogen hydrolase, partial [Rubricoccaceae bacterium]